MNDSNVPDVIPPMAEPFFDIGSSDLGLRPII
jgi:hypothetical protein